MDKYDKLSQSYDSLYYLVFIEGVDCTAKMQCCITCHTWYDIDNMNDDGESLLIINADGDYKCRACLESIDK